MEIGATFIADEINLCPEIVMKSLVPSMDLNINWKNKFLELKKN